MDRLWQAVTDELINPEGGDEDSSTFRVNRLQLAYLHFCAELLSQQYHDSGLGLGLSESELARSGYG